MWTTNISLHGRIYVRRGRRNYPDDGNERMVVFVVLQCEIISLCSLSLSTDESIKIQKKMKE